MQDPHDLNPRFHSDGGLRAPIEWLYGQAINETDVRDPLQGRRPPPVAPANLREELPWTPSEHHGRLLAQAQNDRPLTVSASDSRGRAARTA